MLYQPFHINVYQIFCIHKMYIRDIRDMFI